jgi:peptidylprolyl isomerase
MSKKTGWLLATAAVIVIAIFLATRQPAGPAPAANQTATAPAALGLPTAAPTAVPLVLQGATTTASGLQFLEITPGTGEAPKVGDVVTMQYIASLADGAELANTYTQNKPVTIVWSSNSLLPGWKEAIGLMKVGGKSKVVIPPALAFGEQGNGSIPPNAQIVIEMELLSVKPAPVPTTVSADQLTKTASGLEYYDIVKGDGAEAVKNGNVSTQYSLWVKTDTANSFIGSSDAAAPVSFVVGRGDVVFPGWEEGVTGMKVGGKRLLVIPAALGLGAQANGDIPANAILVMEIQLVTANEPRVATKVDEKDYTTTQSGLKFYDLKVGDGASPTAGQTVVVHYTGWLVDGVQFDSSVDRAQPFSFKIGAGNVIPGWDEGVATMKIGGKRQLVVPPALAYGDTGSGSVIPPGATLIFEVELISITP